MKLATLKVNASRNIDFVKKLVPPLLWKMAYRAAIIRDIPDKCAYDPHYSPWLEPKFVERVRAVEGNTGLKSQSLYTLVHFLRECLHIEGDVVECGVWRGGSAKLLREEIIAAGAEKKLHLFDSFEGMSQVDNANDRHEVDDFRNTSVEHVQRLVTGRLDDGQNEIAQFHKGWVPDSFAGLEAISICFAHIDLDLYRSIQDALIFIYSRLSSRGVIVFDDYGFASCPGARKAVDEFFYDKPETPFILDTGQAIVIKQ